MSSISMVLYFGLCSLIRLHSNTSASSSGVRHNVFKSGNMCHHLFNLGTLVPAALKILTDTVLKTDRLSDIDDQYLFHRASDRLGFPGSFFNSSCMLKFSIYVSCIFFYFSVSRHFFSLIFNSCYRSFPTLLQSVKNNSHPAPGTSSIFHKFAPLASHSFLSSLHSHFRLFLPTPFLLHLFWMQTSSGSLYRKSLVPPLSHNWTGLHEVPLPCQRDCHPVSPLLHKRTEFH